MLVCAAVHEVVILGAARTPIGSFMGALESQPAPQLGATALTAAMERAGVEPGALQQVNMGCVLSAGQGQAPARQAALGAGCDESCGAITINKVCGSGMRATMIAANDLRCGDYQLVAAGGMESMSRAPFLDGGARAGHRLGHGTLIDSVIHDGLWDPYGDKHMGNCAELCAREYAFSREQQDDYAIESYRRSRAAWEDGTLSAEVVPVETRVKRKVVTVDRDEDPFRVDLDRARELRPVFDSEGTVTAANASNINDGAAALVLSTADYAQTAGLKPIARVVAQSSVAQAPEWFTTAPVAAIRAALDSAGWSPEDVDLFEINEAFSVVVLACMRDLGLDHEKVNVNGGAVAMGHPIGASGARIIVTLLHALEKRGLSRGCAAICIGGGEATAVLVERL